ncbi:hypothetical protein M4914_07225 [Streptomyces somaliensis DSM 40738]|uniref:Uncharacterized protein n=1 Tax=Streptomyces somaliensis (strain ATCC 33201 / DSM 40738 / JCM 12659 / KCTC 9044 / NCTC 11332 / NRRL B-12077 / IP 733) TaxID=1134445 RepID=A0AA44DF15_STRE0|nr:hypothetical protein [Streptomyces somaliensis]MCQ0022763.1 hypothetical protein [Streptomyces somaliensis DSM 40738]NKY15688.1 hypothetical protein [Streptomyces somaliensis DSM 40738]
MTAPLHFAEDRGAAGVAAFLGRLLHYDRAAAVRLRAGGGVLAVFGSPPSFDVLAVRTAALADDTALDTTVSAGELLDGIEEAAGKAVLPAPVTGPPWSGVLPPRGGWREVPGLPDAAGLHAVVAAGVAEFRVRDGELPPRQRTRAERDRIGREIWSRPVAGTGLPLRAVHAARSLGFLPPPGAVPQGVPLVLLAAGPWLRLRTPYGSVAVRTATGLGGLGVTPLHRP